MRIKKGYFIVILGVGFMLINIWLNARTNKSARPVNNVIPTSQSSITEDPLILGMKKLKASTLAQNTPGITILGIRPEDRRKPAPKSPAPEETISVSTGIAEEGKTLTPKEQKEMNAKGIIIF